MSTKRKRKKSSSVIELPDVIVRYKTHDLILGKLEIMEMTMPPNSVIEFHLRGYADPKDGWTACREVAARTVKAHLKRKRK